MFIAYLTGVVAIIGALYCVYLMICSMRDGQFKKLIVCEVMAVILAVLGILTIKIVYEDSLESTSVKSEIITEIYVIETISESGDNYIAVCDDESIVIIPKNKAIFSESQQENEMVIVEKSGEDITKATFFTNQLED